MSQNVRHRASPPSPLRQDCVANYENIRRKASSVSGILIALSHNLAGFGGHIIKEIFKLQQVTQFCLIQMFW